MLLSIHTLLYKETLLHATAYLIIFNKLYTFIYPLGFQLLLFTLAFQDLKKSFRVLKNLLAYPTCIPYLKEEFSQFNRAKKISLDY